MPLPPYEFAQQKKIGTEGEARLDRFFRRRYQVTPASDVEQSFGIDRWFWYSPDELPFSVEYKTDKVGRKTSNGFLELCHSDRGDRSGWAYTSRADILVYYVTGPGAEMAYWIGFGVLRTHIPHWMLNAHCRLAHTSCTTTGLVVPLAFLERIADYVYQPEP